MPRKSLMSGRPSQYTRRKIGRRGRRLKRVYANVPRGIQLKKHYFKQTYYPSSTSLTFTGTNSNYTASDGLLYGPAPNATTTDLGFSLMFRLADLPQQASLTALFDSYKISKCIVRFIPQVNVFNQPIAATGGNGSGQAGINEFMNTVLDFDDINNPTSITQMQEYESLRSTAPYKAHKRVVIPAISVDAFKTSGTTIGYSQKRHQWIDAAYNDVEHYGLKGYVEAAPTVTNCQQQIWKVLVTMYIAFKQVR